MSSDPPPAGFNSFPTREAARPLLFDLIRRNGEIDRHHLRIVCELPDVSAASGFAMASGDFRRDRQHSPSPCFYADARELWFCCSFAPPT
jgi:hypothetical protein